MLYKIGDRVKVRDTAVYTIRRGDVGTIKYIWVNQSYPISIEFDSGQLESFRLDEIEHPDITVFNELGD